MNSADRSACSPARLLAAISGRRTTVTWTAIHEAGEGIDAKHPDGAESPEGLDGAACPVAEDDRPRAARTPHATAVDRCRQTTGKGVVDAHPQAAHRGEEVVGGAMVNEPACDDDEAFVLDFRAT